MEGDEGGVLWCVAEWDLGTMGEVDIGDVKDVLA